MSLRDLARLLTAEAAGDQGAGSCSSAMCPGARAATRAFFCTNQIKKPSSRCRRRRARPRRPPWTGLAQVTPSAPTAISPCDPAPPTPAHRRSCPRGGALRAWTTRAAARSRPAPPATSTWAARATSPTCTGRLHHADGHDARRGGPARRILRCALAPPPARCAPPRPPTPLTRRYFFFPQALDRRAAAAA